MRESIVEQRQKVLLIAPAALRDGPWRAFQNRHADFHFECISFEQLRAVSYTHLTLPTKA